MEKCYPQQLLPLAGLEPARPKRAQRPQRGTSTNFVTRAVLPYSVLGKAAQVKVCICSKGWADDWAAALPTRPIICGAADTSTVEQQLGCKATPFPGGFPGQKSIVSGKP